ncbi:MAG TPA: alpha/beta hydrolase-fold protein, partial [Hyphomicrobiaceae bacterium]|nr:alpha/beta hydrolase-fold protein [Hyphomicrobiaceae bacterium]
AMRLAAGLAALLGLMASWLQAPATAGGRFTLAKTIPSRILGRPITYTIYRPDSRQAGARFPVLYLLHGLGDNENAWLEHGGIRQTLDRLIDSGRIKPLIVVMPMAGNSWYVDDARKAGYGPMARALGEDFIAGIDGRYHTHACRERRALGGLSMGGYGAMLHAFGHPDRYSAAISLSGSLFRPELAGDPAWRQRLSRIFGGVFGDPFDPARFMTWNIFPRVEKVAKAGNLPAVWLAAGDDDFSSILDGTVKLHQVLLRRRAVTQLRIDDAGHTWSYWSKAIVPALEWLSPRLEAKCADQPRNGKAGAQRAANR